MGSIACDCLGGCASAGGTCSLHTLIRSLCTRIRETDERSPSWVNTNSRVYHCPRHSVVWEDETRKVNERVRCNQRLQSARLGEGLRIRLQVSENAARPKFSVSQFHPVT
jgi:hypothetical protein